jgi:hypothetical protein
MKKILIFMASIMFIGCATTNTENTGKLDFMFGLLEGNTMNSLDITKNHFVIPHKVATMLPYFGFKIIPSDNNPYSVQTILYLPSKPLTTSGNLKGSPDDYKKGIESHINTYQGRTVIGYRLEPGDPYGEYKLVVLVNGKQWKIFTYNVVPESA